LQRTEWLQLGDQLSAAAGTSPERPAYRRWLTSGAIGTYCLFVVVPATLAALRGGAARGDIRKDARVFAEAYGSDVAAYFSSAPRAAKLLELSALIVLPIVLYLLVLPRAGARISLGDLGKAAVRAGALVLFGHGSGVCRNARGRRLRERCVELDVALGHIDARLVRCRAGGYRCGAQTIGQ